MKSSYLLISLFIGYNFIAKAQTTLLNSEADKKIKGSELIKYNDKNKTLKYIKLSNKADVKVSNHKEWLKSELKLKEGYQLKLSKKEVDPQGKTHFRYKISYNNVPIEGAVYYVHIKENKVSSVNGNFFGSHKINTIPKLSEKKAFNIAIAHASAEEYIWEKNNSYSIPKAKLVIIFEKDNYFPVYKFDIYSIKPLSRKYYYVNAHNGEIVRILERIHDTDAVGTAVTRYNGTKSITADSYGGSYRLRESGRGGGIETYDLNNGTNYASAVDFTDSDNYWDSSVNDDDAAYDAHYGTEATYDYYFTKFGRNSFDNSGAKLISYVHYSSGYVNAFWNGEVMTYGDGDGFDYTPLTSIDIVAHEITHGVTEYSANLIYSYESGALNESFSDIFGVAVDFYANPGTANYLMGEQISVSGTPFRSMENPNQYGYPDTYLGNYWYTGSGDYGGVHYNSSVMNYWFFLLCEGGSGTNDNGDYYNISPIGMDKAAQIAYRNLTVYLTPFSQYTDARFYAIQSAIDLFGECSDEVIAVTNAWNAVGVGDIFSNAVIADFTVSQTYFCSTPAIANFTNSSTNGITYLWDFGDSNTSTLENPSHNYENPGIYTVQLIASGSALCGNTDTLTMTNLITVDDIGGPISPTCTPTTINSGNSGIYFFSFDSLSNTTLSSDSYQDYTCSHSSTIIEGNKYNFSVTTGPTYTENVYLWLDLNNDGQFNNDNELIAQSLNILQNHSDSIIIPEGTVYDTPLRLRVGSERYPSVLSDACSNSQYGQYEDYSVIVKENTSSPVAEFIAENIIASPGDTIQFIDQSLHVPATWEWEFIDGSPESSALQNPKVVYDSIGTYDVKLIVTNAFGSDTIIKTDYIKIANVYTMCSSSISDEKNGILYDSGGPNVNYSDNENCSFLIDVPCATEITLSFNSFNTQYYYDGLMVYDGANQTGTLLLNTSGSTLPSDVTAISGKMYIMFYSNSYSNYEGFEAEWTAIAPPDSIPNVDFSISDTNPPLNTPVQFTDKTSSDPVEWQWIFGDGNSSNEQHPIHTYNSSGSKQITLVANNCFYTNVAQKSLTVQEAPTFNINIDTITAAIDGCNDSISIPLDISNTGNGDLVFSMDDNAPSANFTDDFDPVINLSLWSNLTGVASANCGYYNGTNALYFNDGLNREAVTIDINTKGGGNIDFYLKIGTGYSPCEDADYGEEVYLEYSIDFGTTWNPINVYDTDSYSDFTHIAENIPSEAENKNTRFRWKQMSFSGSGMDNWSIDQVSITTNGTNSFISYDSASDTLAVDDTTTINIQLKSTGLNAGVITDILEINTNDPLKPNVSTPVVLTLTGYPSLELSDTIVEFDTTMQWTNTVDSIFIKNTGCDTLFVTNISNSLTEFSIDTSNMIVLPGDSGKIQITFSPTTPGNFVDTIFVLNNDIDTSILLNGIGIGAPIINISPDSLYTILTGCDDSITLPLSISNEGLSDLYFNINGNSSSSEIELLALTYGVDYYQEYTNTIAAINQYFTNYNLTEINTTLPNVLESNLVNKDVLLIAEQENGAPSIFSNFAPVLIDFVNNGGSIIFCGTINEDCIINTTLFNGHYTSTLSSGQAGNILDLTHPLVNGLSDIITTDDATYCYNFTNNDAICLAQYNNNYNEIVTYREIGNGHVVYIGYDFYSYNDDAARLISNAVQWSGGENSPEWLNFSVLSDTIPPNNSINIDVTFKSAGLTTDIYTTDVVVGSNDPLTPETSVKTTLNVSVSSPCVDFDYEVLSGGEVVFTDQSLNSPTSWDWDFGDGSTSSLQNPTHIYSASGTYEVSLTACNASDCDETSKQITVLIITNPEFTMCSTLSTTQSSGTIYDSGGPEENYQNSENCSFLISIPEAESITLSFNSFYLESYCDFFSVYDGNDNTGTLLLSTSGNTTPSPVTALSGNMYITFTSDGSVTYPGFEALWTASYVRPDALFSYNVTSENPYIVEFDDQSTNDPTSWAWNFGDGTNSTIQNPTHTFPEYEEYEVTLTSCNSSGCDTIIELISIKPVASFTYIIINEDSHIIEFEDQSTNNPTSWAWNFGDGNDSNEQNPIHMYSGAGTYEVLLTSCNSSGCDSASNTINIIINVIEEQNSNNISVYPIPSGGRIFINLQKLNNNIEKVEIFDVTGKKIYFEKIDEIIDGHKEINLNVQPGFYYLKVYSDKLYTKKIIIK